VKKGGYFGYGIRPYFGLWGNSKNALKIIIED
jgi:hypothetical protein